MKCDGLSETEFVELAMSRKQQEQVLLGKFGICQCFCAVVLKGCLETSSTKRNGRHLRIAFWRGHVLL